MAEAGIRMSIKNFYTETIILLDHDTSTGGYMSTSTSADYTTALSIPAAINQLSANEIEAYGKLGYDVILKGYCDVTTEVYGGRRCRWSGDTYQFVTEPKNTLQKNHHFKILLGNVDNA